MVSCHNRILRTAPAQKSQSIRAMPTTRNYFTWIQSLWTLRSTEEKRKTWKIPLAYTPIQPQMFASIEETSHPHLQHVHSSYCACCALASFELCTIRYQYRDAWEKWIFSRLRLYPENWSDIIFKVQFQKFEAKKWNFCLKTQKKIRDVCYVYEWLLCKRFRVKHLIVCFR